MSLIEYAPGQFARVGERVTIDGREYRFHGTWWGWLPGELERYPSIYDQDLGLPPELLSRSTLQPERKRRAMLPEFTNGDGR